MAEEKDDFGAAFNDVSDENPAVEDPVEDEKVEAVEDEGAADEIKAEDEAVEPTAESEEVGEPAEASGVEGAGDSKPSELETLRKQNDELQQYQRSNEGRVGALQRKINELEANLKQPPAAAPPANTQVTQEEWTQFEGEYPEIANAMNVRMAAMERQLAQKMEGQIGQAVQPLQSAEHDRYVQSQVAALGAAHPDWREVVQTESFTTWLRSQPKAVQSYMGSEDAGEASYLLDTYKQSLPQKAETGAAAEQQPPQESKVDEIRAQREKKLKDSQGIKSRPNAGATGGVPDDFDAAFKYFASEKANVS